MYHHSVLNNPNQFETEGQSINNYLWLSAGSLTDKFLSIKIKVA